MYKNYQGHEISSESQNCNTLGCKCEILPHSRRRLCILAKGLINWNRNFNKYQNTVAFANPYCPVLSCKSKLLVYEKKTITALGRAFRGNYPRARNQRPFHITHQL